MKVKTYNNLDIDISNLQSWIESAIYKACGRIVHSYGFGMVIAPLAAEPTSVAYFARAPVK